MTVAKTYEQCKYKMKDKEGGEKFIVLPNSMVVSLSLKNGDRSWNHTGEPNLEDWEYFFLKKKVTGNMNCLEIFEWL